jgi:hypothetical protein
MSRIDISNYLVHFTKGSNAMSNFRSIVTEGQLRGGTGFIKGGQRCVCFTEAPLHALQDILDKPSDLAFRYAPFGVIVTKRWLFAQGGRPVIYQADAEFAVLPAQLQWRHVMYEPAAQRPIDFTWEREWRIPTQSLRISPENAWLVVSGVDDLRELCEAHSLAKQIPSDLFDPLEDTIPLSAVINGITWTVILVRSPPEGWIGLDVDLE